MKIECKYRRPKTKGNNQFSLETINGITRFCKREQLKYKWIMKDRYQNYWPCPNKGYDRSNDIIILPGIVSQNQQLF